MRNNIKRLQLTPIFIVSFIALFFYIGSCIIYLIKGHAEAVYITGIVSLFILAILVVERIVIRILKINRQLLWICESIALALFFIITYFISPKLIRAQVDKEVTWFAIIETEGPSEVDFRYRFPKHYSFKISKESVFIINKLDAYRIQIEAEKWKGNESTPFTFKINTQTFDCRLYSDPDYKLNVTDKTKMEQLINEKLAPK